MLEGLINSLRLGNEEDYEEDEFEEQEEYDKSKVSYFTNKRDKNTDKKSHTFEERERTLSAAKVAGIVILKPIKAEDATDVIDQLMAGKTTTVDLGHAIEKEKQRIIDMITGYCYCSNCNMQQVTTDIFIVSHSNIQSSNEEKE